ncbi:SAM-dependent methyltransferase [Streptomyces pluripotens]|uniref:S-adenosyl-L-methionine-dependent methyltransferase n=1 Tax=Streptomyces pluripotens TaxID=1355015 RepID=A0A221P9D2_9ACTN|nr:MULTISPECIES: class I SAM-dependent methyltransferase [Streptomyces]ARP74459.1 SAM-dependent methyltransferase [Streptomyces pluripotens]ASN28734.1 SAM-dependent methyltransferase [Streptomyces pluripotens]KIE28903.1 methyltransferase [Streptomyces sp. MUSC 125]MCH0559892.1 class I SAM-dependent methyltransferase [Streptomyces sp. MUM 16J]
MPAQRTVAPESTAVRVALWRAMHAQVDEPPHVLQDEIGLELVAPGANWHRRPDMGKNATSGFRAGVVARARFVEDLVADRFSDGVRQYVILGAGLDTFAQRHPELAAEMRVFEIDQYGPQEWKRQRLSELGYGVPEWLRMVPVDFEKDEDWWGRLIEAGFDLDRPAVLASTGVSMYLTKDAVADTLAKAAQTAQGSAFAMTFLLPPETVAASGGKPRYPIRFRSCFTAEEMLQLARAAGFHEVRHLSTADLTERYFTGRPDGLRPEVGESFLLATT